MSGPLLRPQAAQAEVKTRKMGFGAAAGAQMKAGEERREPGLALDWLVGLPGAGQQQRAEERRQTVGLCHPGVPAGEFFCLVPGLVIDERVFGRRRWGGGLAGLAARRKRGFGCRRCFGYFGRGERGSAGLAKIRGRTLGAGTLPCPLPCPRALSFGLFLGHALGRTPSAPRKPPPRPISPKIPAGRQQGFRIAGCRLAAQAQIGVRPDEGMGGAADVHAGLMENEVLERARARPRPRGRRRPRRHRPGRGRRCRPGFSAAARRARASVSSAADSGPMRSASAAAPSAKAPGVGTGVGPAGQGLGGIEGPAAAQENTIESIPIKA